MTVALSTDRVRMTQRDRVLYELERAGLAGVSDRVFYIERRLPNARTRVGELLDEGYHIGTFPDPDNGPHERYVKFALIHGPGRLCAKCPPRTRIGKDRKSAPPVQMTLA